MFVLEEQSSHGLIFYFLHWLVAAFALLVTCKIMPGWKVRGFGSAMMTAVVIGLANALIWPILIILTLPINIMTLGLFTFVVNGAIIKICSGLLDDFEVKGWGAAILGSLILSLISTVFHFILV
jgi:putative membrane protein